MIICIKLEEEELLARLAFVHFGLEHVHGNTDAIGGYKKKLVVRHYIHIISGA
jgi:hypothetical protein